MILKLRGDSIGWQAGWLLAVLVGSAGCTGDDGKTPLINVTDEPVGLNCQYGGSRIDIGYDEDGDGLLGNAEVRKTSFVCRARVDGDSSLIAAVAEPAGANCAQGGVRVQVGLDDNDDRVLQPNEVDATTYVCDGLSRLMNLVVLPVGGSAPTGCETGGVRVESGRDINDNGSLQPEEVDVSYNVCNGRASLTNVTAVTEGSAPCADGGIRVQSGFDLNGNNLLDSGEVTGTRFVCNGADGFNTLVRTDSEPASPTGPCLFGGIRIKSGLDTNKNNVLDASEVLNSFPVCAVQVNSNLTLVKNTVIVPGAVCQFGGVKTEVGIDDNNDFILQASEVDSTTNNCNSVIILDGVNSLVETVNAGAAQCPFGGFVFRSGLDQNRNNTLESGEVTQTRVVCNGANGFNTLVDATGSIASSPDCGGGSGLSVKSGLDLNRNNVLDPSEVQRTSVVCDGFPGFNSAIRTSDAGSACGLFGGIKVQSGVDDNPANGVLDAAEVETTAFVCNGRDGVPSLIEPRDPGSACGIYGGVKYVMGWDENFDGVLESSEIIPAYARFVCNGADGLISLVDLTEGDWSQCPGFGVRVDVGLDRNWDGVLSSSEVTSTAYVCDGVSAP